MTRRRPPLATCIVEQDSNLDLGRRAAARGVGTVLPMLIVAIAGLAAQGLRHGDPPVSLLASAIATAGATTGLIVAIGEALATVGLLIIVFGWSRSGRRETVRLRSRMARRIVPPRAAPDSGVAP